MIQPFSRAPNCSFIQENSETQDWSFPFTFDYIHARNVGPCFTNFALVCQRAYDHTSPGGWIELQDASWDPFCIDDSLSSTALERWFQIVKSAGTNANGDVTKTNHYKGYLQQAGYIDIVEVIKPVPSHPWAQGRKMKVLGAWTLNSLPQTIDSYRRRLSLAGLSIQESDDLTAQVQRDLQNPQIHWYMNA